MQVQEAMQTERGADGPPAFRTRRALRAANPCSKAFSSKTDLFRPLCALMADAIARAWTLLEAVETNDGLNLTRMVALGVFVMVVVSWSARHWGKASAPTSAPTPRAPVLEIIKEILKEARVQFLEDVQKEVNPIMAKMASVETQVRHETDSITEALRKVEEVQEISKKAMTKSETAEVKGTGMSKALTQIGADMVKSSEMLDEVATTQGKIKTKLEDVDTFLREFRSENRKTHGSHYVQIASILQKETDTFQTVELLGSEQKELKNTLAAHVDRGVKEMMAVSEALQTIASNTQAATALLEKVGADIQQLDLTKKFEYLDEVTSELRTHLKDMVDNLWSHSESCAEALRDVAGGATAIHENSKTLLDRISQLRYRAPPTTQHGGRSSARGCGDGGASSVINLMDALGPRPLARSPQRQPVLR